MSLSSILRISDAASLGLHSMVIIADSPGKLVTTEYIADQLEASKNHLSKVLQTLSHSGFVRATRGPGGGFMLAKPANEIRLLDVFQAIEGPVDFAGCLLHKPICGRSDCIMGDLAESVNTQFIDYFTNTTLQDLIDNKENAQ